MLNENNIKQQKNYFQDIFCHFFFNFISFTFLYAETNDFIESRIDSNTVVDLNLQNEHFISDLKYSSFASVDDFTKTNSTQLKTEFNECATNENTITKTIENKSMQINDQSNHIDSRELNDREKQLTNKNENDENNNLNETQQTSENDDENYVKIPVSQLIQTFETQMRSIINQKVTTTKVSSSSSSQFTERFQEIASTKIDNVTINTNNDIDINKNCKIFIQDDTKITNNLFTSNDDNDNDENKLKKSTQEILTIGKPTESSTMSYQPFDLRQMENSFISENDSIDDEFELIEAKKFDDINNERNDKGKQNENSCFFFCCYCC